jgi:dihydroorotate dehydrogenase (NAD+) catalytic subunit
LDYNIPIKIGGIELENPVIVASGLLGLSQTAFDRLYNIGAGAVVSKSISLFPREGYRNPTILSVEGKSYINAVGLANPGVEFFTKEIQNNKIPLIVSIVGSTIQEFTEMVNKLKTLNIIGFELNLSCPHVEKMGMEIGDDPKAVCDIIKAIKNNSNKPLFVKVGIGNSNLINIAKLAEGAGADGITAINTVRAMKIDINTGLPILENKIGGLSGASIKPIGVRCVYELKKNIDIPIIGCGGILSYEDVIEYLMAGASAVQVGSILGFEGIYSFIKILTGLDQYLKTKGYKNISEIIGIAHR